MRHTCRGASPTRTHAAVSNTRLACACLASIIRAGTQQDRGGSARHQFEDRNDVAELKCYTHTQGCSAYTPTHKAIVLYTQPATHPQGCSAYTVHARRGASTGQPGLGRSLDRACVRAYGPGYGLHPRHPYCAPSLLRMHRARVSAAQRAYQGRPLARPSPDRVLAGPVLAIIGGNHRLFANSVRCWQSQDPASLCACAPVRL